MIKEMKILKSVLITLYPILILLLLLNVGRGDDKTEQEIQLFDPPFIREPEPAPEPKPVPPPHETVIPCEDKRTVKPSDVTSHGQVYDLGQQSGRFEFVYETYKVPDHIMIFDGSSDDPDQYELIFNFSGSTNGARIEVLEFTNRYVYVKTIDGGSGTSWNYTVKCPKKISSKKRIER